MHFGALLCHDMESFHPANVELVSIRSGKWQQLDLVHAGRLEFSERGMACPRLPEEASRGAGSLPTCRRCCLQSRFLLPAKHRACYGERTLAVSARLQSLPVNLAIPFREHCSFLELREG